MTPTWYVLAQTEIPVEAPTVDVALLKAQAAFDTAVLLDKSKAPHQALKWMAWHVPEEESDESHD